MMKFKNQLKRGLSLTLTLAMCMGTLQVTAMADEWSVETPSGNEVTASGDASKETSTSWSGNTSNEDGSKTATVEGSRTETEGSSFSETENSVTSADPAEGFTTESNTIPDNGDSDPAVNQSGTKVESQTTTTTDMEKEIGTETETITETTEGYVTENGQIKEETATEVKEVDTTDEAEKVLNPVKPEDAKLDISAGASAAQGGEGTGSAGFTQDMLENAGASLNPDKMLKDKDYTCAEPEDQVDGSSKYTKGDKNSDYYSEAIVTKGQEGDKFTYTTEVTTTQKSKIDKEIVGTDQISDGTLAKLQVEQQLPKVGDKVLASDGKTELTVTSVNIVTDEKGFVKGYTVNASAKDDTVVKGESVAAEPSSDPAVSTAPTTGLAAPVDGGSYTFSDGKVADNVRVEPNYDESGRVISYTVTAEVEGEETVTRTETVSVSAMEQMVGKENRTDITGKEYSLQQVITYVYYDGGEIVTTTKETLKQSVELKDKLSVTVSMGTAGVEFDENDNVVSGHGTMYEKWPGASEYNKVPGSAISEIIAGAPNLTPQEALGELEEKFNIIKHDEIIATGVTVTQDNANDDTFAADVKVDLQISQSKLSGSLLYLDIKDENDNTLRRAYLTDEGKAYWKDDQQKTHEVNVSIDENGTITGVEFKEIELKENANTLKLQLYGYQKTPTTVFDWNSNSVIQIDDCYTLIDLQADVTVKISGVKAEYEDKHEIAQISKEDHEYARQETYDRADILTVNKATYETASREVTDTKTTDFELTHSAPEETPGGTTTGTGTGITTGTTNNVVVADPAVPLAEAPETVEVVEPAVPLAETPDEVVVTDEAVPLADAPAEVVIPDDVVPLAEVPKTGDISGLWYAAAALSACGLAALRGRKREEEDA